jgi:hypothetical protein
MSLKENLKTKIKLDRILQSLVSTVREPPARRWLDKELTKELLAMTDFEHKKMRDLHLYIRPLEGKLMRWPCLTTNCPSTTLRWTMSPCAKTLTGSKCSTSEISGQS